MTVAVFTAAIFFVSERLRRGLIDYHKQFKGPHAACHIAYETRSPVSIPESLLTQADFKLAHKKRQDPSNRNQDDL